jgi:hypothetical protein
VMRHLDGVIIHNRIFKQSTSALARSGG